MLEGTYIKGMPEVVGYAFKRFAHTFVNYDLVLNYLP